MTNISDASRSEMAANHCIIDEADCKALLTPEREQSLLPNEKSLRLVDAIYK